MIVCFGRGSARARRLVSQSRLPSAIAASHQSESQAGRMSSEVNRKTSALFYGMRRGTGVQLLNNFTIKMRSESPESSVI